MTGAPRFYCPQPLFAGAAINLPTAAARHVQVLRLQPGDNITLFGGAGPSVLAGPDQAGALGGEFEATISAMGRQDVQVLVGRHHAIEREAARRLQLAIGVPANERMDWLVEKATELGVAAIQPLMTGRSVVRLDNERARKKTVHWTSIAIAACEQCGRNRLPSIHTVASLATWLQRPPADGVRFVLSLRPDTPSLRELVLPGALPDGLVTLLSGPEGGLSEAEEALALRQGFQPVSLGARVLRSETAALVALTLLT